ncbi:MAG: hypothetical protein V1921_02580 [Candidatus Altiarchaeota archaeon]
MSSIERTKRREDTEYVEEIKVVDGKETIDVGGEAYTVVRGNNSVVRGEPGENLYLDSSASAKTVISDGKLHIPHENFKAYSVIAAGEITADGSINVEGDIHSRGAGIKAKGNITSSRGEIQAEGDISANKVSARMSVISWSGRVSAEDRIEAEKGDVLSKEGATSKVGVYVNGKQAAGPKETYLKKPTNG